MNEGSDHFPIAIDMSFSDSTRSSSPVSEEEEEEQTSSTQSMAMLEVSRVCSPVPEEEKMQVQVHQVEDVPQRGHTLSALSRAKTQDRARTSETTRPIHKLPQRPPAERPLTAGAWRSKVVTATPQEERPKSASPESTLNRRKVFIEADWVGLDVPRTSTLCICNASRSLIDLAHQANFLARQKAHLASKAKHFVIPDGYISGLRPTPLLPIMHASGYRIQGCIYTEADERNKRQQGKSPTWARSRKRLSADSVAEPDMHFQSFLQRQREALARRDKRGHPREEVPISV